MSNTEPATGAVPLSAPYYGASLGSAFSRFWRKYSTFSGRASRSEYWWWILINSIITNVFLIIGNLTGGITGLPTAAGVPTAGPGFGLYLTLSSIWGVAVLVPGLALMWRRLHDTNRSGASYFLGLIPIVGPIMVLVFVLSRQKPEGARFDR